MGKLIKLLRKISINYTALKYLLAQEKDSKSKLKLQKKIWCLFHGFSSEKYELYNFDTNNHKLYLSDYKRRKTSKINEAYSLIINDKNIFSKIFTSHGVTAKVFGTVKNGVIVIDNHTKTFGEFIAFVKRQRKLIIKKYRGGGGKGIYKLTYEKDSFYLNDQPLKEDDVHIFMNDLSNHQIVEHLSQASYSNNIYSGTINSIRIITMMDPETNEVFIPIAVHKFGSETTKPVDNVWNGGMTAKIDIETGILGKSAYHHENNNKIEWKSTHPDTDVLIEGTEVPGWAQVIDKVKDIAQSENYLKYVGWDVVVTDNGVRIIEGNNYSDVNILQIHQPLLMDERVKKFYKHYGII